MLAIKSVGGPWGSYKGVIVVCFSFERWGDKKIELELKLSNEIV
jgi:hypothetical protein